MRVNMVATTTNKGVGNGAISTRKQKRQGIGEESSMAQQNTADNDANNNVNSTRGEEGGEGEAKSSVSTEDIQLVQNLIEKCLQLYLTKDEVVSVLREQATIDPEFTQLIWSKLEEQNPDFFKCYYTRLKLKAQIVMFNHLLEQQVQVIQKMQRGWQGNNGSSTASGIPLFCQTGGPGARMHSNAGQVGMDDPRGSAMMPHHSMYRQDGATPERDLNIFSAETGGSSPLSHFNGIDNDIGDFGGMLPSSGEQRGMGLPRNISMSDLDFGDGKSPLNDHGT